MRKPSIALAPEGITIILFAAFVTFIFAISHWCVLTIIGLIFTTLSLNFFRDPERVTPDAPGLAVSPADGKIINIGPAPDPLSGHERLRICVFMNVFNVHVNRSPVDGAVSAFQYHPGKFINASFDKASEDNERLVMGLVDPQGRPWTVVQIAGLLARRIVCRADLRDELKRGERYGLIKFGSRVDLYLPEGYAPAVAVGDKVLAGQTVLAQNPDEGAA